MSRIRSHLISSELIRCGVTRPAQKLTGADLLVRHVGVPLFYVYRQGLNVEQVKQSLRLAATHHPMVCGRLQNGPDQQPVLIGNDAGMSFDVYECKGALPDYGPHHPMHRDASSLSSAVLPWQVIRGQQPLMRHRVYRFEDGAAVLSINTVHSMVDGSTMWNFLMDWSAVARGLDVAGPVQDRDCMYELMQRAASVPYTRGVMIAPGFWPKARLLPQLAMQAFSNKLGVYRISAKAIEGMRQTVPEGTERPERISAADLITAHAIKLMAPTQGHRRDRVLGMVSDLRYRKALNLPQRMFGNALGQESCTFSHEALSTQTEGELALAFKQAGAMHSAEESMGYLGLLERHRRAGTITQLVPQSVMKTADGGFVQNNYLHLPIYGLDLGTGKPTWFNPQTVLFRMLKLVPTPEGDGSVDIYLTAAPSEHPPFEALYGVTRL